MTTAKKVATAKEDPGYRRVSIKSEDNREISWGKL